MYALRLCTKSTFSTELHRKQHKNSSAYLCYSRAHGQQLIHSVHSLNTVTARAYFRFENPRRVIVAVVGRTILTASVVIRAKGRCFGWQLKCRLWPVRNTKVKTCKRGMFTSCNSLNHEPEQRDLVPVCTPQNVLCCGIPWSSCSLHPLRNPEPSHTNVKP